MSICLGRIGMSREDFWEAEWGEIMAAVYGHFHAEQTTMRRSWEIAQLVAFAAARPHYKQLSPEQIVTLPWLIKPKVVLTPEQIEKQKETERRWDLEEKNKWEKKQQAKRFKK